MSDSNQKPPAPSSDATHSAYIWRGLGFGLFVGIFVGLREPAISHLGPLVLSGAGAAGAIMGSVLFRTRHWARNDYTVQVLRLAHAAAIAGFVLNDLAVLGELHSPESARIVLAIVPGTALGFTWAHVARNRREEPPRPSARDVFKLFAAGVVCLLWMWMIIATSPVAPS
jgi:hypothetical protein